MYTDVLCKYYNEVEKSVLTVILTCTLVHKSKDQL